MKKLKKVLKILLIIIISLIALIYGGVFLGHKLIFPIKASNVPAIEGVKNSTFTFGTQAHLSQPAEMNGYITILAGQLKQYNKIAPALWPDNALTNQSLIVEQIRRNKFWHIAPDGAVTPLSKTKALGYGIKRQPYFNGFSFFDDGMYLAVSEEDLTNYLLFQQYLHLGTYDVLITCTHEGFHAKEQPKWQAMNDIPNRERDEFFNNTSARAKRDLLQRQLLRAVSEPGNIQPILDSLATYSDWKIKFPEDYKNSIYFDRIEGTAYYYELVSSLYSAYPNQVRNEHDLDNALALLATRDDIYINHGLIAEGYTVGGFSCVMLDRLSGDWKERLMNDPEATPIELLSQYFKDETLPAPQQPTKSEIDPNVNDPDENRGMPLVFRFLYDILF